jgi:ADP-ribose pyrophosphatase
VALRWKKDSKGKVVKRDGKPVLQFVAIERKDTKEWAIPGGMVDPGEKITSTLQREFMEEATNSDSLKPGDKAKITESLKKLFSNGEEVYKCQKYLF